MKRLIIPYIQSDLENKIVILTGPRQAGKTTLSKELYESFDYFNYDAASNRLAVKEMSWDRKKPLIIFDELHKMKLWKQWLKGLYDTEKIPPRILVTGSAKLNTYKKVGDSLAGRYFQFRLHPFDLKETKTYFSPKEAFERLWHCSGFPEPFLKGSESYYRRWKQSHQDIILRQDLLDLESVRDIKGIETLLELLKHQVGGTISYANLARTLERDPKTVKAWLQLLEDLYLIFRVTPYSNHVSRSILKEPKYYFYDFAQIADEGAKLENIVASALLKELHFLEDTQGVTTQLNFLRTRDKNEIDFLVVINNIPRYMIEVKSSDDKPSKHFDHFTNYFQDDIIKLQLVKNLPREKTYREGVEIRELIPWLSNIDLA